LNFRNDLWQEKILFPSAALPASGFEGMFSAGKGTPKVCDKGILFFENQMKSFILNNFKTFKR